MSIDKSNLVVIREGKPADRNFILATFLRGLYYGDSWFSTIPKDIFMNHYHSILERFLELPQAKVRVACLKDDSEVILGYSVVRSSPDAEILDWVFVKSAWRRIGIGKSLVPVNTTVVTHLTKLGKTLKPKNVIFNPFL